MAGFRFTGDAFSSICVCFWCDVEKTDKSISRIVKSMLLTLVLINKLHKHHPLTLQIDSHSQPALFLSSLSSFRVIVDACKGMDSAYD